MARWRIALMVAFVVHGAAVVAVGQTSQPVAPVVMPAVDDSYQDKPLPARRGAPPATTRSTGVNTAGGIGGGGAADYLDLKRVAIALAIVLGAIYVSNRIWRRLGMPGAGTRPSGALQVMSRLVVAPKQQVMLIRVGTRRLVLVANNGTQMTALSEITDPEEAAVLIGQVAVERESSSTATFHDVLGAEEKQFDPQTNVDARPTPGSPEAEEEAALAATRDELNGMMEKVRDLSKQFRRA
jgi:flagellar biogenesis protein FliO